MSSERPRWQWLDALGQPTGREAASSSDRAHVPTHMTSTFLGRLSPSERERLLSSLSPDASAAVVAHLKHLSMTDHQSEATRFDVTSDASDASDAPNAPPPLPLPREPPCSTDPVDAVAELYRQMAEPTPPVQPARVPPAPSAVLDPLAPPEN